MRRAQRLRALYDIVESFAGPIAELYHDHPIGPYLQKKEAIPRIIAGNADEDGDCVAVRQTIEWLAEDNLQVLLSQLWDIAYVVVVSEWVGLVKVARVLRKRQTMKGSEFEAEWRKVRQSEVTRSRREMRLASRYAGWRAQVAPR